MLLVSNDERQPHGVLAKISDFGLSRVLQPGQCDSEGGGSRWEGGIGSSVFVSTKHAV